MDNLTMCHDSNEPLAGIKLPRGQAGVSILWPTEWNSKVKKLKVGNERVIAVTINSIPSLCIINAYLPTQASNSQYAYEECLDLIYDIIMKYENSYEIILCGDLNGTLLNHRNNKHDQLLKKFVKETGLKFNNHIGSQSTFFHHAQTSESQIDYILTKNSSFLCK